MSTIFMDESGYTGEDLGTLVLLIIPDNRWETADIHEPLA